MSDEPPRPYGLLAELTHRCPLHCPYCSNPIQLVPRGDELPGDGPGGTPSGRRPKLGILQIGFSGGEPLLHLDLTDLIATARDAGLYSNLITSGLGLTSEKAGRLREAGLDTVQISLQADEAEAGDRIAGTRAHEAKLAAIQTVRDAGLPWSANVVLHRQNIGRVPALLALARELGAIRIELANTQFYGWAFRNRHQLLPTRAQVEEARAAVEKARAETDGRMQIVYVLPDYFERRPKPCLHGWASRGITINPRGDVLPCQAAESIPASPSTTSVRVRWPGSGGRAKPSTAFRGTAWMPEPCQSCDFRGDRFRRLPLPGGPAHRRPGRDRSGL